jgi:hypothetical protein
MILRNSTNSKFSFQRQKSVHELEVAAAADMWRRGVLARQAVLLATYLSHEDKVFVRDDEKTCSDVR